MNVSSHAHTHSEMQAEATVVLSLSALLSLSFSLSSLFVRPVFHLFPVEFFIGLTFLFSFLFPPAHFLFFYLCVCIRLSLGDWVQSRGFSLATVTLQ